MFTPDERRELLIQADVDASNWEGQWVLRIYEEKTPEISNCLGPYNSFLEAAADGVEMQDFSKTHTVKEVLERNGNLKVEITRLLRPH